MNLAATVAGRLVPIDEVDAREALLRSSPQTAALPRAGTSEGRQLRRWLTQLLVVEHVVAHEAAVLGVTVHGLRIPDTEPVLSGLLDGSAHGGIRGVYLDPVFEGISVINIGLDAQRGFYVFGMEAPNRLVIDIQS